MTEELGKGIHSGLRHSGSREHTSSGADKERQTYRERGLRETGTAEVPDGRGGRGEKVAEQVNKRQKQQGGRLVTWRPGD